MEKIYPSDPIVVITNGKDRGLMSLLEWIDPLHDIWDRTNGGQRVVITEGGVHTLH